MQRIRIALIPLEVLVQEASGCTLMTERWFRCDDDCCYLSSDGGMNVQTPRAPNSEDAKTLDPDIATASAF